MAELLVRHGDKSTAYRNACDLFTGTGWKVNVQCIGGVFTVEVRAGSMKYVSHGADLLEAAKRVAVDAGVIPYA